MMNYPEKPKHVPVLYRREGSQVRLLGHWAKPNPQWHAIGAQRALFIFHGPHAYVSPRWYADPQRHVPTWNYAAAHLHGRVEVFHEPEQLESIVAALAERYEGGADQPSSFVAQVRRQQQQGCVLTFIRGDSHARRGIRDLKGVGAGKGGRGYAIAEGL